MPTQKDIDNYLKEDAQRPLNEQKPFIYCEYTHSMGNSTGNLKDFWDGIRNHRKKQGGFIWDWMDQGLELTNEAGEKYYGYGGDFEPDGVHNDSNFCANGVVFSDMTPQPALMEVKKMYQNIWVKHLNNYTFEFYNEHFFITTENYSFEWKLMENGVPVASGTVADLLLAPQAKRQLTVNPDYALQPDKEYFLDWSIRLKSDEPFLEKGHEVAKEQFLIQGGSLQPQVGKKQKLKVKHQKKTDTHTVQVGEAVYTFSKSGYGLQSITIGGERILEEAVTLNFWRAPIDNDFGIWKAHKPEDVDAFFKFKDAAKNAVLKEFSIDKQRGAAATLTYVYHHPVLQATNTLAYHITAAGTLTVSATMKAEAPETLEHLPRYGMTLALNAKYIEAEYYGKGPFENYVDRNNAAHIAYYQTRVSDFYVPYIRPQENGYRTETRFLKLSNGNGQGLQFTGITPFSFSAHQNPQKDFDGSNFKERRHTVDIKPTDTLYLNIDSQQNGVGGNNSWSKDGLPLEHYRIDTENYSYSFMINILE